MNTTGPAPAEVTSTESGGRRLSLHFDFLPDPDALWSGTCLASRTLRSATTDLLCHTNVAGEPVFPLLRNYSVTDGGRLYRFQLADGLRFHDGTDVTARDVLFSIEKKCLAQRAMQGEAALARRNPIRALRRTSKTKFEIQCDPAAGDLPAFLADLCIPLVREGDGVTTSGLYRIVRWSDLRIELELHRAHLDASESLFRSVTLLPLKGDDTLASLLSRRDVCVAAQRVAFWCSHEIDASRTLRFHSPSGQVFVVALARHAGGHVQALRDSLGHLPGDKFLTFQSRWLEPLAGFFPEGHPLSVNVEAATLAQAHPPSSHAPGEPLVIAVEEGLVPQSVLQEWQWFLSQMGTSLAFKICARGTAEGLLASARVDGLLTTMWLAENGLVTPIERALVPLLPHVSNQAGELQSLLRQARSVSGDRGRHLQALRNFLRATLLKSGLLPACFVPEIVIMGAGVKATGRVQPQAGIDLRYLRERPDEVNEESLRRTKLEAVTATTQMLAHDVRKPFSLLRMAMDLITRAENLSEARTITERLLPEVDKAIDSVNGMIEDLLEVGVARTLNAKAVDVRTLVRSSLLEAFAAQKSTDIVFSFELEGVPPLLVDAGRMQRVFSNILTNAVQAMGGHGRIWVKAALAPDDNVTLTFGNDNSHIEAEEISHVFEAFYTRGKRGGTGLGLAIVEKIVLEHGGRIACASSAAAESVPSCVEFYVTLPLAVAPRAAIAPSAANEIGLSEEDDRLGAPGTAHPPDVSLPAHSSDIARSLASALVKTPDASPTGEAEARKLEMLIARHLTHTEPFRILVIDDEDLYRDALSIIVAKSDRLAGVMTVEGLRGEADLRARLADADFEPWDLVICDVDLGADSADGFALVRLLRERGLRLDICMHSNQTGIENFRRALEEGADVFLPKPMSRLHLLKLLEDVTRKRSRKSAKSRGTRSRSDKDGGNVAVVDDNFIVLHAWKKHLPQGRVHVFSSQRDFWNAIGDGLLVPELLMCVVTDHYFDDEPGGLDFLALVEERFGLPVFLQTNAEFPPDVRGALGDRLLEKRPYGLDELAHAIARLTAT